MSFHSTFTPSLMSPETLEAVFVQREDLARRLVSDIRASATTAAKHYHLLIGARGMGKTHLVSLVRHRIAKIRGIDRKLAVAWLREDEHGITSFLDFLLRVRDVLAEGAEAPAAMVAEREAAFGSSAAEDRALREIDALRGQRTLLVIVENFDEILRVLGRSGQEKLRAHLQTAGNWTILATAQGLAPSVRDHAAPFYGFFDVDYLQDLSLDDSLALLKALAVQHGDADLARLLDTPGGRARVRVLRHLAGGNHRVHVIFARFLTAETLADITEPLLRTLDEMTPYYQARMAWLSPQQRKIVEAISDARGCVAVKDLARACRITQQVASGQLKTLRSLGYVVARERGRESHYELAEPMLRLVTDLKKHRGETIGIVVEFLVTWFSLAELAGAHRQAQVGAARRIALEHALRALLPRLGNEERLRLGLDPRQLEVLDPHQPEGTDTTSMAGRTAEKSDHRTEVGRTRK